MPLGTLGKDVAFPLAGKAGRVVAGDCRVLFSALMESLSVSFLFFGFYFLPENCPLDSCVNEFCKHQLKNLTFDVEGCLRQTDYL